MRTEGEVIKNPNEAIGNRTRNFPPYILYKVSHVFYAGSTK